MMGAEEVSEEVLEVIDPCYTSSVIWSNHAVNNLLELFLKYRPLLKQHRKKQVFFLISTKLKELNINKNSQECSIKLMQLTKEYQQYFEQKARGEKFLYGLPFEYEMTSILDESTIEEATANLQKDLHSIESPYTTNRYKNEKNEQWSSEAVEALLEHYNKYRGVLHNAKYKSKDLFELISKKMRQENFAFSEKSCNQKMTILLQHSKNQPSNSSTNLAIDEKLHQIFYVKPEPLTEEMLAEFEDTKISLDEIQRPNAAEFVWSKDDSFNLISIMQKYRPMMMKEKCQKYKHSDVFQLVAYKLEAFGVFQTAKQINIKFYNMQRTYNLIKNKPGRQPQKFPYYSAMDRMYESNKSDVVTKQMKADIIASMERYEMEVLVEKEEIEDCIAFDSVPVEKEFLDEEFLEFEEGNSDIHSASQINLEQSETFMSELMSDQFDEETEFGSATILVDKRREKHIKKDKVLINKNTPLQKVVWSDHETIKLLELYALYKPLLVNSLNVKSYSPADVYELISQRLLNHGVHRSGAKCSEKMNNLNRTFKICLRSPNGNHSRFKHLSWMKKIHSIKNKTKVDDKILNDVLAVMACRQGNRQNNILGVVRLDTVVEPSESSELAEDEETLNDFDDDESERNQFCERSFWGIPETERFIQIYTDNYEEKQNIAFWMMLAKKMEEEGFEKRSDITLKQKFSNLRRSYKVCEARNKNRRNKIFKFNFYDLMEAALNPKTSGSRWTENQTNELIKAYSQIKQFSPDNLFEKVSKMLSKLHILRSSTECSARWTQLNNDMKLFKSTGEKTQSYPYFNAVEAAQMGEKQKVETILSENFCILKDKSLTEECTTPFNFVDIGSETSCTVNIKQEIGDRFLNASTLDKLINLKYEYSLKAKSNSWKLPMEIWKRFTEKLKMTVAPASLKFHFYNLLKKYKLLKMQHKSCGDSVHWDFFSIFESAFENKTLCMESAIQDLQLTTSEKIQYVIDHFMEVCKVCLEPSENMTKLDDSEARLIQKINFLFYEEGSAEQLDPNVTNLICSQCLDFVETFNSFKKQFKFTSKLLVEVIVAPSNLNEEMDQESNETEDDYDETQKTESDLLIEIAAEAENLISPEQSASKFYMVNGKKRRRRDGVCDVCGIHSKNLASHQITHTTAKKYSCSHCGKKFLRREACRIHVKTHLKIRDYHCQSCTKTFTSIQCLKKHQAIHNRGVIRHTCDICGFGCYLYSVYVIHRANKHGIGLNHVCEICHKGFLYPKRLKQHMNIHEQTKDHICGICSKTFTLRASMLNHKRLVHIKGQDCPQCEKSFAYPKMLKDHLKKDH